MNNESNVRTLQEDLGEILHGVNWDYVSLPCIVDIIRSVPLLRVN